VVVKSAKHRLGWPSEDEGVMGGASASVLAMAVQVVAAISRPARTTMETADETTRCGGERSLLRVARQLDRAGTEALERIEQGSPVRRPGKTEAPGHRTVTDAATLEEAIQ
jgi:hypothetical protein